MSATRPLHPTGEFRGVNVIVRRDGSEVFIGDIATVVEGQALLDEMDSAILAIETQIERNEGGNEERQRRAAAALKIKRRLRNPLQQRIAQLRKAERNAERQGAAAASTEVARKNARRAAFVATAERTLDRELYVELWTRAAEANPTAFEGWEGVSA